MASYVDLHLGTIDVSHIIHPPLMEKQKHNPPRSLHGNSIASCVTAAFHSKHARIKWRKIR